MNVKQLTELTTYLNTLSKEDQCGITVGACYDGYVFVQDYYNTLDASKMIHELGYVYINSEKWWALEAELPA